jgi:tetratricopeptide (TPR) repeat protein
MAKVVTAKESFLRFLEKVAPSVKLYEGANGAHVKSMLSMLKDNEFEMPEAVLAGLLLTKKDVPPKYLADRDADRRNVEVYLNEAQRRLGVKDADGAVRVLSSIIEEFPSRGDALRLVGYRLLDLNQAAHAVRLFDRVQRQRPFEPHSYLDLARSLEQSGKYGLAAVQYEIALAGQWHGRFHESLKDVAREDYGRMMRQAIRDKKVGTELADHFGERLEKMDPRQFQSDLRVSMSWNTDATDIDLWVFEPDGTKCFYSNRNTPSGGELSQDMTQGYGPERYQMKKAVKGEFKIVVHNFRANPNLLGGETHVNVNVTRFAGTPQETVEKHTVILKTAGQEVEVCKVKF